VGKLRSALIGGFVFLGLLGSASGVASAASISGTVTASGGGPIEGIEVCPQPEPFAFEADCAKTNASGVYSLNSLPAASYSLHFSAWPFELNYVQEWYGGDQRYPGDLVDLGAGQDLTGVDAELEPGGVITGTASDAGTLGPAAEVWVCVEALEPVFYGSCHRADSAGEYETNDLPSGEYRIAFDGENDVNYLRRFYDEEDNLNDATPVPVTAGSLVSGIDALLQPGAQILGRVTEAGTGAPLGNIEVCLWRPGTSMPPEYVERCTHTDSSGNYAIRSLPADTYDVVFSQEAGIFDEDTFAEQWWKGAGSSAQATPLTIAPPQTVSGIDAQLVDYTVEAPEAPVALALSPRSGAKPALRKCRKGFHRKLVKGKKRCVRKHRRHHKRRGKR